MKQVEYTEEQKIVIDVIAEFTKEFKGDYEDYEIQIKKWHDRISRIMEKYGIKEQFLTLREYLSKHSSGAYHHFVFQIYPLDIDVIGIEEFERYYNSKLLDEYFVIGDKKKDNHGNCENYQATHYLEIVRKD